MAEERTELVRQFVEAVKRQKLTPTEVAEKTGISKSAFRTWKRELKKNEPIRIRTGTERAIEGFLSVPAVAQGEQAAFVSGVTYVVKEAINAAIRALDQQPESHHKSVSAAGLREAAKELRRLHARASGDEGSRRRRVE